MKTFAEERLSTLRLKLGEAGHRMTGQRICILRSLLSLSHPTADEIYLDVVQENPSTSLATIYKTLETLKSLDEVQELEIGDGRRHYDGLHPEMHPHVICTTCGRIEDLSMKEFERLARDASKATGYLLTSHKVEFFGLCGTCQQD